MAKRTTGLLGLALALLSALPAQAGALTNWRFDGSSNRLTFQTSGPVTPQAQLIFNPQRIVIDLPGTEMLGPKTRLPLNGAVREVRVAETQPGVTRLVIELAPGTRIDPKRLQLQGLSPTSWQIQLEGLAPSPGGWNPGRSSTLPPPPMRPFFPPAPAGSPQPQSRLPRSDTRLVVIDPGHGGRDVGAIGIDGLQEKELVFDVSRQVAALLSRQGLDVKMSREDDREIDLEPRVRFAERLRADLFVSIHANAISLDRPEINGLETYYYASDASRRLASTIHRSILDTVPIRDRGVRQARFYVLRRTSMPAVLVEIGFVTGSEDGPRLQQDRHRRLLAEAIARGITSYTRQN